MRKLFHDHPFWSRLFFAAILVLAATFGHAQGGPGQSNYPASVTTQSGAPSGNCPGTNVISLNIANGAIYTCPVAGSSWTAAGGTGSGTVSANSGTAGAVATYASAGGSTTVGADPCTVTSGTGTLTVGGAAPCSGPGALTLQGSTSGSASISCNPATTCTALTTAKQLLLTSTTGITLTGHLNQAATGDFANSCSLSSGTCTWTIANAFTTAAFCVPFAVSGTVTGTLTSSVASTTVTIADSVTSDTATVGSFCVGKPN